ncbi:energy transducer TonB [Novosphingobium album (ex Hu et al. 2023)]|uniref:TonB family protein n=1 Tax=Novosphingobium album (ex Hu et al. 2023) TaxID=2930093 RepID=A0ABT0B392_9SPHN|nr:energy transducer TonB [Novosphingobium album (ex Hu et al. 2023)]MCJ2179358.1 TonB family protein [Novosphingobium album (ex Hu et al. 2023)]
MSYADGNSGSGRKALTGGTVALIQAGLALALVNGFAVHFIKDPAPPHTGGTQIPLEPLPPKPTETPEAQPERTIIRDNFTKVPDPLIPVAADPIVELTPPVKMEPASGSGEFIFIPAVTPSDPPPPLAPKGARPRNDAAQWVTTNDYPTSDIRLGHTGTVRFRLAIDTGGRVTDCTIVQSSGYDGLDAATCRNLAKRARFDPATGTDGQKVPGSYAGTIRWVIPQD